MNHELPNVDRIVCADEVVFASADDVRVFVMAECAVSFVDFLEIILADVETSVMKECIVDFDDCSEFVVDGAETSGTVVRNVGLNVLLGEAEKFMVVIGISDIDGSLELTVGVTGFVNILVDKVKILVDKEVVSDDELGKKDGFCDDLDCVIVSPNV